MDEDYLTGRIRASLDMAAAAGSTARLIHLELAGRYSLLAAKFATGPFPTWTQPLRLGASSGHRPQTEARNDEAGAAELLIVHDVTILDLRAAGAATRGDRPAAARGLRKP